MEQIISNWSIIICAACATVSICAAVARFLDKPTEDQVKAIKEWLLYAVTMAEKDLGSGTGKLKLRRVYDVFLERFPWAAKCVTFNQFRLWVDEALVEMQRLLESGGAVKTFLEGK